MYKYLVVRSPSDFSNLELGSKTPSAIITIVKWSFSISPGVHFYFSHMSYSNITLTGPSILKQTAEKAISELSNWLILR